MFTRIYLEAYILSISCDDFYVQIIGLPDSYRGANLEKELEKNGFKFTAKVGVLISNQDFQGEIYHDKIVSRLLMKRQITRGEIGCSLAHQSALQRFLATDKQYGMIFEDDATLFSEINFSTLDELLKNDEPTVVLLGFNDDYSIPLRPHEKSNIGYAKLLIPSTGAYAYCLNRAAAAELSTYTNRLRSVADWPFHSFRRIDFFIHLPKVAKINSSEFNSEIDKITPREFHKKFPLANSLVIAFQSGFHLFYLKVFTRLKIKTVDIIYVAFIKDLLYKYALRKRRNFYFS